MTSALSSAAESVAAATAPRLAVLALAIGAVLAARGQGIVATMVSVNIIYIGSIAVVLLRAASGDVRSTARQAGSVMGSGVRRFVQCLQGASWAGLISWFGDADLLSLIAGLLASGAVFLARSAYRSEGKPSHLI